MSQTYAPHDLHITKADGTRQLFKVHKLRRSLRKAGASPGIVQKIVEEVTATLKDGNSTQDIYRNAFERLRAYDKLPSAARYSLRRAIFDLGPTGFPFEDFISELFAALGYTTATGQMVRGKCTEHEVDVLAHNEEKHLGAELKFHNRPGVKTDLQVALYVYARFEDIKQNSHSGVLLDEGWLITNTKFTSKARSFATCAGLTLLGWNYPRYGNLQDLIAQTGIYPITCLSTLTQKEKAALLSHKQVLCKNLAYDVDSLKKAGVQPSKLATVIEESQALCAP